MVTNAVNRKIETKAGLVSHQGHSRRPSDECPFDQI
jgi:hypothetical protein